MLTNPKLVREDKRERKANDHCSRKIRGFTAHAKNTDPFQPVQTVQADMGQSWFDL